MTDRELLELSAKAAGLNVVEDIYGKLRDCSNIKNGQKTISAPLWNPLSDDGDALRLAVKLNLNVEYDSCQEGVIVFVYGNWDGSPDTVTETFEGDEKYAAIRRAIVRAAAEIGKTK